MVHRSAGFSGGRTSQASPAVESSDSASLQKFHRSLEMLRLLAWKLSINHLIHRTGILREVVEVVTSDPGFHRRFLSGKVV